MLYFTLYITGLDDWDIIAPVDVPQYKVSNLMEKNSIFGALTGAVSNLGGRTVSHMQKVMGKSFFKKLQIYS